MTKEQAKWAASHDWYIATMAMWPAAAVYTVLVEDRDSDGISELRAFNNFRALRRWAGY